MGNVMNKITKTNKVRSKIRPDFYSFSIETRYNNLKIPFFFFFFCSGLIVSSSLDFWSLSHGTTFKLVKEQPNEVFAHSAPSFERGNTRNNIRWQLNIGE